MQHHDSPKQKKLLVNGNSFVWDLQKAMFSQILGRDLNRQAWMLPAKMLTYKIQESSFFACQDDQISKALTLPCYYLHCWYGKASSQFVQGALESL